MTLRLEKIELCEIAMPLKHRFETSFGTTTARRILLVRIRDVDGCSGWSECTAMENPFYNHETIESARTIITKFAVPMLRRGNVGSAADVPALLKAIQGNRMAIAAVETAVWDLEAKKAGVPLWKHLGGTRPEIDCGVSIGIQKSIDELIEAVTRELASGYQRIKIKIKPGHDVELVRAVRARYPDITLSVDANSAYTLEKDAALFEELDQYGLLMIEQPLAAGDLVDHAKLQKRIRTPLCMDESITSLRDARHALELDACRIINIKLGRVGGHCEARAIQEYAVERDIPVWCGGMLESGIGRAHNIAMSTLPGFTLPGDVSASSRYWAEDIIEPPVTVSPRGTITPPDGPGIGFEVKEELIGRLTASRQVESLLAAAAV